MLVDEMESRSAADGRYRTLLEVSGAIASQPNLKAVLHSLRRLLSSVVAFDSVSLSLLSDNGKSVRLIAFDRGSEAYQVEIGTEFPHVGSAVGRALAVQKPIYITAHQASPPPQRVHLSNLDIGEETWGFDIWDRTGRKIQPRRCGTHDLRFIACRGCPGERNCHRCRRDVPTAVGSGARSAPAAARDQQSGCNAVGR